MTAEELMAVEKFRREKIALMQELRKDALDVVKSNHTIGIVNLTFDTVVNALEL